MRSTDAAHGLSACVASADSSYETGWYEKRQSTTAARHAEGLELAAGSNSPGDAKAFTRNPSAGCGSHRAGADRCRGGDHYRAAYRPERPGAVWPAEHRSHKRAAGNTGARYRADPHRRLHTTSERADSRAGECAETGQ